MSTKHLCLLQAVRSHPRSRRTLVFHGTIHHQKARRSSREHPLCCKRRTCFWHEAVWFAPSASRILLASADAKKMTQVQSGSRTTTVSFVTYLWTHRTPYLVPNFCISHNTRHARKCYTTVSKNSSTRRSFLANAFEVSRASARPRLGLAICSLVVC